MIRAILPLGFAAFSLLIGAAALNAADRMMQAEAIEICHRLPDADPARCGALPR